MSTPPVHPEVAAYLEKNLGITTEFMAHVTAICRQAVTLEVGQSDTVIRRVSGCGDFYAVETALLSKGLRTASLRLDLMSESDFAPIPFPILEDGKVAVKFTERTTSLHRATENADVVVLEYSRGTLERIPTAVQFEKEFLAKGGRVLHLIDVGEEEVRNVA